MLALEGALRSLACGELDVRGREEFACSHERLEVDLLVGDLLDVASPDRPARVRVWWPDREHVVEAAGAQEGGVEAGDPIRRADEQMVGGVAQARDLLEKLIGDAGSDPALLVGG